MLLDEILPTYEFGEVHEMAVRAALERVWCALREVTLEQLPVSRALLGLRALPGRLTGRPRLRLRNAQTLFAWAQATGFLLLGERANEELVFGTITQPWRLFGGRCAEVKTAEQFVAYQQPGYVKVASNFRLERAGGESRTRVITQTRVFPLDAAARRKFRLYWYLIRPGSGLIRREWLRAIRHGAEAGSSERPGR